MAKKKTTKNSNNVQVKVETPDISTEDALLSLKDEIIDEAIKIEEGRTTTVFPLVKLAAQYKELRDTTSISAQ